MFWGLVLIAAGAGSLIWLAFTRRRLERQRERERELPWLAGAATTRKVLSNLPLGLDIGIQAVASAVMLALGLVLVAR